MKTILLLVALLFGVNAEARTNYNVYRMPSTGNLPGWGAIDLSQAGAVTGVLPVANGGSGSGTSILAATIVNGDLTHAPDGNSVFDALALKADLISPSFTTPNLGTPSAAILTNATGLPISTGVSGLAAGIATFLGTSTSANLAAALTDETGTGASVFANSPVFATPNMGTPSVLVGTNITGTGSGFTAGTVTTNANMTGDVTSVGNATTLATVNGNVGAFTNANITVNAKGLITAAANGTAGTGNLSAKFDLEGAIVPYTNFGGNHYQVTTQSLTAVNISAYNSGTSGSTTIRVNQTRSGALFDSETASLSASSENPAGSNASLSGTLSLLAGDIITVDVISVAGGSPESLTVEY